MARAQHLDLAHRFVDLRPRRISAARFFIAQA
jgi:hypothetical protein